MRWHQVISFMGKSILALTSSVRLCQFSAPSTYLNNKKVQGNPNSSPNNIWALFLGGGSVAASSKSANKAFTVSLPQ